MARPRKLRETLRAFGQVLRRFAPYLRQERSLLAGAFAALFTQVLLRLLELWPLKFIFDGVFAAGTNANVRLPAFVRGLTPETLLTLAALGVVIVVGARAFTEYLSTIGFALAGNRVLTRVRADLYAHLQRLPLAYHHRAKGGDLTLRVTGDVGMLKEIVVTAVLPMLGNVLVLLGMLGVMFALNWRLALVALAVFPLFWVVSTRQGKRIHAASRQQRQWEAAMAATTAESLGAIKLVQSLALEGTFARSFEQHNSKDLKDGVKVKRLSAGLERSVDLLIALATALVLWYGARLALSGTLTPGDLLVFVTYLKSAFRPMRDFAKYTGRLAKAAAAGERVLDVFDTELTVRDAPNAVPALRFRGHLRFEDVSFAYAPDQPVLRDVTLDLPAGHFVAVVGPSGGGKSTLAGLVSRLYDPTAGHVLIDGQDLRAYQLATLRPQISVVLQDNLLFGGTLRDNIALGVPGASDAEVVAAARLAHAHDFISALPQGYDTPVGERGATLSGGQRQRVTVARAALRHAPILVLDEPTTGLDEHNEQLVIDALLRLARQQTTLLITHNLSFAAHADHIVYLEDGRVLEQGRHTDLLQRGGRYAALYAQQTRRHERDRLNEEVNRALHA